MRCGPGWPGVLWRSDRARSHALVGLGGGGTLATLQSTATRYRVWV
jgi:hypothetical protein